jgi:hypothetical protein
MSVVNRRHVANPIVQHGNVPKNFAAVANDLVKDRNVTSDAYRVLCLLLSHTDGYEESKQAVANRYGWGSEKTAKAFAKLVDEQLLIIQRHVTATDDHRAYEKYHVHRAGRRFTDDEVTEFGTMVVLPTQNGLRALPERGKGGTSKPAGGHTPEPGTTEEKQEHQMENQVKAEAPRSPSSIMDKKQQRTEVRHLVDAIIPATYDNHVHVFNVAMKAMDNTTATTAQVEVALGQWLTRTDVKPGLLWSLILDAVKNTPKDLATVLRECIEDPDWNVEPLKLFGAGFNYDVLDPPDNKPRDCYPSIDCDDRQQRDEALARGDAWDRERRREWVVQLQRTEEQRTG